MPAERGRFGVSVAPGADSWLLNPAQSGWETAALPLSPVTRCPELVAALGGPGWLQGVCCGAKTPSSLKARYYFVRKVSTLQTEHVLGQCWEERTVHRELHLYRSRRCAWGQSLGARMSQLSSSVAIILSGGYGLQDAQAHLAVFWDKNQIPSALPLALAWQHGTRQEGLPAKTKGNAWGRALPL